MSIAKVQTIDRTINQLQDNIQAATQFLFRNAMLNGLIIQKVPLVVGNNPINHKLNRSLQGWYLVRQRALANIYDNNDSPTVDDSITLLLVSDAIVTVDIYVF